MLKPYGDRERKKGTTDLLVLALIGERKRHGYEIAKLIEQRSGGNLSFQVASLSPLLYRLERKGWIKGRWVEKPSERRRRKDSAQRAADLRCGTARNPLNSPEVGSAPAAGFMRRF